MKAWFGVGLALLGLSSLLLAWLAHDAPVEPSLARGWLRADLLSALTMLTLATHAWGTWMRAEDPSAPLQRFAPSWSHALALVGFAAATVIGHLGLVATLLVVSGLSLTWPWPPTRPRLLVLLACCMLAVGLSVIGLLAGEWRYGAALAGSGRNLGSIILVIGAVFLTQFGCKQTDLYFDSLVTTISLYTLLRLFSFGPWEVAWLLVPLCSGLALTSAAAWHGANHAGTHPALWFERYLIGVVLTMVGLASSAGVAAAGYALLVWPWLMVGLGLGAGSTRLVAPLLTILPLSSPFVVAWMSIAAALAGENSGLAIILWGAALLMALPVVRWAKPANAAPPPLTPMTIDDAAVPNQMVGVVLPSVAIHNPRSTIQHGITRPWLRPFVAGMSLLLGLGAPLVLAGLLGPLTGQLLGGLSPYGELAFWPWAGIIALDSARRPVATLPSFALLGFLLILAALSWLLLRFTSRHERQH